MPGRGHVVWLDWLKVLLVAGICYFHATQPFVVSPWLISNDELSAVLRAFAGIGYLFGIPLLFLAAGRGHPLAGLRSADGRTAVDRLGGHVNAVLAAILLFVPLASVQLTLRPSFPRQHDWADF